MRVVVYSDEDLEPITVLNLPIHERDLAKRGYRWMVPVPEPISITVREEPSFEYRRQRIVELWFEWFVRRGSRGEQRALMCFTKADELAMLLNPAWLPGQLPAIRYLEEQNDALTRMLMTVLS